jgi:hypothetical protein
MYNTLLLWIKKKDLWIKASAVSFLLVFGFIFLHSEFGLYGFDGGNHGAHDYSTIVKTSTIEVSKGLITNINKLKVVRNASIGEKPISSFYMNGTIEYNSSFTKYDLKKFRIPKKLFKIYLNTRTLLI